MRTSALSKRFGSYFAVNSIDLAVPTGAVYGFLGPNGSGKTTTIRMLLGLLAAHSGDIEVLGEPMPRAERSVLPRVGALVEGPAFYPHLTGANNLARLLAVDSTSDPRTAKARAADALDRVGLTAAAGKRYRHYSLGMKQRLGLAAAMLRRRELLVLDEPMNGLDPQGTREVRALIRELNEEGTTVIVSSHLLSEVEQACSHVGIMSRGALVFQGSLDELGGHATTTIRVTTTGDTRAAAEAVLTSLGLEHVAWSGDGLAAKAGQVAPEAITAALVRGGVGLTGFEAEHRSLEDVFVELTGAGFDVAH